MEKVFVGVGASALFLFGLLIVIPLGTLMGGICGWVVGLFFENTILGILKQIGIDGVTMFQVGAFTGFFGSFPRARGNSGRRRA